MRLTAAALSALTFAASCERAEEAEAPFVPPPPRVEISASDELAGLSASPTGIAFWAHPNVAFNSLMIVASADGLVAYNIEDGNEAARVASVNAQGAAVSYLGFGALAAGVVATFDAGAGAFRFYGIDNASRAFLPFEGGPSVSGDIRGFCFGRAAESASPSLFVVEDGAVTIFNVDFASFELGTPGFATYGETRIETPGNIVSCAVDTDGVLLIAAEDGAIYRVDGEASFEAPFAPALGVSAGDLAVIAMTAPEGAKQSDYGEIALIDRASGDLAIYDRASGAPKGVVSIAARETLADEDVDEGADGEAEAGAADDPAKVAGATIMGATGTNLGGIYRNGVIAVGIGGEEPLIRLIPYNGVQNALSLAEGAPISPRGAAPTLEEEGLIIEPTFTPAGPDE